MNTNNNLIESKFLNEENKKITYSLKNEKIKHLKKNSDLIVTSKDFILNKNGENNLIKKSKI